MAACEPWRPRLEARGSVGGVSDLMRMRVRNPLGYHDLWSNTLARVPTRVKYRNSHNTKRTVLSMAVVLAVTAALITVPSTSNSVEAQARIELRRNPNPPCYLINDGATPQAFWWRITFGTVPNRAAFRILDPEGAVVHSQSFDLTGQISPVYNPENTVGDAGIGDHAYSHGWSFGQGIQTGLYRAELEFWSDDVGRESSATQTFLIKQRVQVYKYNDVDGDGDYDPDDPPLQGWEFSVTGPESFSGTTDSTGYAVFPSRNPAAPCALADEAYRDILQSGTYTVTGTPKDGWTNTDPGDDEHYQKTFTVPHHDGETIRVLFGSREVDAPPPEPPTPPDESQRGIMRMAAIVALSVVLGIATIAGAIVLYRRRGVGGQG